MSNTFDPYHRWLGIPKNDQPADHYRLLGLVQYEADPDVIRDAAERQMSHVRRYANGEHAAIANRILNELASARVCLLDATKRRAYDLQRQAVDSASGTQTPSDPFEVHGASPITNSAGEDPLQDLAASPPQSVPSDGTQRNTGWRDIPSWVAEMKAQLVLTLRHVKPARQRLNALIVVISVAAVVTVVIGLIIWFWLQSNVNPEESPQRPPSPPPGRKSTA